jgi:hypothetical protein
MTVSRIGPRFINRSGSSADDTGQQVSGLHLSVASGFCGEHVIGLK